MKNNIYDEDQWDDDDCDADDRDEDDWDEDDWKGENLEYYKNVTILITSLSQRGLQYWENIFRTFLERSARNLEVYDVDDNIQVVKQKGNAFIYINNQPLGLCVLALLQKIFDKEGPVYISEGLDKDFLYIKQVENVFRRSEEEVQSKKSFKLLCCELKQ
ncbi:MAG: hypothetical protein HWN79_00695 [Candidatus Lokiarchaeota archaeon]|nr:hypothetical protein [Candidatus Lokiarchaeota archaeon]